MRNLQTFTALQHYSIMYSDTYFILSKHEMLYFMSYLCVTQILP